MQNWFSPHYLQQEEWAATRKKFDWNSAVIELENDFPVRIYHRKIPMIGTYAYSPLCGPVLTEQYLDSFLSRAKDVLPNDTFCIKIEPEQTEIDQDMIAAKGLKKAKKSIQFQASVRVDLTPEDEDIKASFEKGTRYNVRKAGKRGVKVREVDATEENLEELFAFKRLTSKRGEHYLRPKQFLMDFWQRTAEAGKGHLFFAEHEDDILAALFVVRDKSRSWNKDSGSSRKKRSLAAPSLMHWEAMRIMKSLGVKEYDFSGVSPKKQRESEDNPMRGVDKFKTGFADPVDYVGAYDVVLKESRHALWQTIEWLYIRAYHRISGLYWY